ncbi:hypothetical protein ACFQ64_34495, partial [Streptomyces sp. NPDC056460]
ALAPRPGPGRGRPPAGGRGRCAGVLARLPGPYRDGLVRSRADALHRQLTGRPHDHLGQALA